MIDSFFPAGWQHYLIGGLWIGASVAVLFLLTGLVSGMSAVLSSFWSYFSNLDCFQQPRLVNSRTWRTVFAAGLILGAALCVLLVPNTGTVTSLPGWQLLVGGLLVGFGARLSNGCALGHGICGLASLQLPSLLAVLAFLATAFVTAQVTWWVWGR
jgi:uncharacterized membrane protein YedE/YeeE